MVDWFLVACSAGQFSMMSDSPEPGHVPLFPSNQKRAKAQRGTESGAARLDPAAREIFDALCFHPGRVSIVRRC